MDNFKNVLIVFGVLVLLIVGGIAVKVVFFPVETLIKSVDMAKEVRDKTLTGDNAIAIYEDFKEKEGQIEGLYKQEEDMQKQIDTFLQVYGSDSSKYKKEDKERYNFLLDTKNGIKLQLDEAIASYNAEASKANKAIFKDNLPSNISRAWLSGLELTK